MYYNPYINMFADCYIMQQMKKNARVRILHASPNAPEVDVYANDNLVAEGLGFEELSDYLTIPTGNYNIKIFPAGENTNAVLDTEIYIPEDSVYTIAAVGMLPNISLYPIQEPKSGNNTGGPCIRFIHLSPDAPSVDIKLDDGSIVFDNIPYKGISNYVCIKSGKYTFDVTPAGMDETVLTVPDVKLDPNNYYTVYAVGLMEGTPELDAILATEQS